MTIDYYLHSTRAHQWIVIDMRWVGDEVNYWLGDGSGTRLPPILIVHFDRDLSRFYSDLEIRRGKLLRDVV